MKGIKLSTFAARCVLLTTFCVLLTACSQTDETEVLSVSIGFVPTVEAQARGIDFTKDNLTSLGVLAYLTQGSSFNALSSTPNFMYNQEVTKAILPRNSGRPIVTIRLLSLPMHRIMPKA